MSAYNILALLTLFFPAVVLAGVGIVPERIWVSREPLIANSTTTISTVVQNATGGEYRGVVRFLNGTSTIGEVPFSILPGEASIVSLNWLVPMGAAHLSAQIVQSNLTASTTAPEEALASGVLKLLSYLDSDMDGVPDETDEDDDGDGISDVNDAEPLRARTQSDETALSSSISRRLSFAALPDVLERPLGAAEDFRLSHLLAAEEDLHNAYESLIHSLTLKKEQGGSGITLGWKRGATWDEFIRSIDSGDLVKAPWEYLWFYFWALYTWIVERPWAFYLLAFFLVFWILRMVSAIIHR